MSELMNARNGGRDFRWQLLATFRRWPCLHRSMQPVANADDDADRPTVWIELGGQLEQVSGQGDPLRRRFHRIMRTSCIRRRLRRQNAASVRASVAKARFRSSRRIRIGFSRPPSVMAGRMVRKISHQQTPSVCISTYWYVYLLPTLFPRTEKFVETRRSNESHAIIDFQAGKDVGLACSVADGSSTS